jgi:uncharacterized repeat protein (TIGR01451 family)
MNKILNRRLKGKISKHFGKIIVILAILFVLVLSTGYAIMSSTINLKGNTTVAPVDKCKYISSSVTLVNSWWNVTRHVYQYRITVTNNGNESIESWIIEVKGPSDLRAIASPTSYSVTVADGIAKFSPATSSTAIGTGQLFSIDIYISTSENTLDPEYILFNDCKIYPEESDDTSSDEVVDDTTTIKPSNNELQSIEISPSEYTMTIGETVTLNVTKTPSNATEPITFTSSDENVATVSSDGIVTAKSKGTATIAASYNNISSTSTITVNELDDTTIAPDGIDITCGVDTNGYHGDENYGYTVQYIITIANNTNNNINGVSFTLGLPTGTTYNIWTGDATIENNNFNYNSIIKSGESGVITFEANIPGGNDINNYLTPSITNIQVS